MSGRSFEDEHFEQVKVALSARLKLHDCLSKTPVIDSGIDGRA